MDIHAEITNKIVASLSNDVRPWFKPYRDGGFVRPLRHNSIPYTGVNVLILWITQTERDYHGRYWMTYRQAAELGGQVRKGEKATNIIYAAPKTGTDKETGEEISYVVARTYPVFNTDQIDNLPDKFQDAIIEPLLSEAKIPHIDEFFENTSMDLRFGGYKAFYHIEQDYVRIPEFSAFLSASGYYCTLAHESVHWTKHKSRLDRDLGFKKYGDEGYAMEELVAELGSAFLAADFGIVAEPRSDHDSYIAHWIKVLKNDHKAIFQMASLAERGVKFLNELQPKTEV